jgi:hypothetical protein
VRAYGQGQQIADSSRSAAERAREMLPRPLAVSPEVAAVMAPGLYLAGPVDEVRIQRVADVMTEFPGGPSSTVAEMISAAQ